MKKPISEVVNGVFKILEENHLKLSQTNVEYVVSAMTEWLESNKRGHEMMAHLLQLDYAKGQHDKEYRRIDGFGRLTEVLKPESIVFLRGAVSNGEVLSVREIQISEKEHTHCEGCGARTVCTDEIHDKESNHMIALCSYCMTMSGDPSLLSAVPFSCDDCSFKRCQWNPKHQEHLEGVS